MKEHLFNTSLICFLTLWLGLTSCESNIQNYSDPNQAVVEAYLHPDRIAEVTIYKQFVYAQSDSIIQNPIQDLSITLTNTTTGQSEVLNETSEKGVYVSKSSIQGDSDYRINFEYEGKNVWAETTIPGKIIDFKADATSLIHTERFSDDTIRYVNYSWENRFHNYYLFLIKHIDLNYPSIDDRIKPTSHDITSTPKQDSTYQVNSKGFYYYGDHQMILFKVNQEYVDLYYNSASNSQYMGVPPTNVHNGYGIFTGINTDTLILRLQ